VLQRYIDSPLLLNGGRKFHIRAYVLAVSSLRVYLSRECLALCSGRPYDKVNTNDLLAHITNTVCRSDRSGGRVFGRFNLTFGDPLHSQAYQDRDPMFSEEECVRLWTTEELSSGMIRDGLCASAEEVRRRIDQVLVDMERITAELFRAYEAEFGVFAPLERCFEHYGFDFMIDSRWNVYLLEVNPGPDFKQTGNRLQSMIDRLMASTIDVVFGSELADTVGSLHLVYCRPAPPRNKNERP
jgi:tubulin---tyrosine ligase